MLINSQKESFLINKVIFDENNFFNLLLLLNLVQLKNKINKLHAKFLTISYTFTYSNLKFNADRISDYFYKISDFLNFFLAILSYRV